MKHAYIERRRKRKKRLPPLATEIEPGAIIIGRPNNSYGVTSSDAIMEVCSAHLDRPSTISVRVLYHQKGQVGRFDVRREHLRVPTAEELHKASTEWEQSSILTKTEQACAILTAYTPHQWRHYASPH
jgi:hypothetical protein